MRATITPPHVVIERLKTLAADLEVLNFEDGRDVVLLAADTIAALAFCMTDPDFVRKN